MADDREDEKLVEPCVEYRLVLYDVEGRAHGSLYPRDAGSFSPPLWTFPLEPDQELPPLPPGSIVTVRGRVGPRQRPVITAGPVEIVPANGLTRGDGAAAGRIFAERGEVIAHPGVVGWEPTWRYVRSPSLSPLRQWERRVRDQVLAGWALLAVVLVTVAVIIVSIVRGWPVSPDLHFFWGGSGAGSLVSWRLARRSKRALDRARASLSRPSQRMRMSLKWTAGYGVGPMAVASLYAPDISNPVAHVAVVNVPPRFTPADLVEVDVVGEPTDSPIIRCGDVELWPAEHSSLVLGRRRSRRNREHPPRSPRDQPDD